MDMRIAPKENYYSSLARTVKTLHIQYLNHILDEYHILLETAIFVDHKEDQVILKRMIDLTKEQIQAVNAVIA